MLDSNNQRVVDQVLINDKAKLMQKILEYIGARKISRFER
jgi:hypothetical protein